MGGAFRISRGDSVGAGRETRLRAGIAIALSALGGVNAQTDNTQQPDDIILRIGALSLTRTWTIVFFSVAGALLALILLAIVYFVFFARSSRPHSPSKRTSKTPQNDDDDDTPIAEMQMSGSSVNLLANVPKPGTTDAPVLPITVDPPSSSSATTKPADSPPTALPHNRTVSSTKPPPTPMAPTPVVVDAIPELHEAPDPSKAHGLARFQSQHAKTLVAGTGGSPVSASSLPGSATGSMAPAHGLVDDGFADATLVAGAGAGGGQGTTTAPMASPTTALMSPLLGDLGHSHPDSNAPAPAPAATPTTTLAQAPNISLASSHSPTSPSAHQTTPKSTSSSTRAALHILPTPATPPPDAGGVHLGTSTPTPALETPASLMQTPLALRDPRPFSPRVGLSPARLRVTVRAMLRHHSSLVKSGGAEGDGAGEVFKVARELGVVAGLSKEVLRAASAPRGRKIGLSRGASSRRSTRTRRGTTVKQTGSIRGIPIVEVVEAPESNDGVGVGEGGEAKDAVCQQDWEDEDDAPLSFLPGTGTRPPTPAGRSTTTSTRPVKSLASRAGGSKPASPKSPKKSEDKQKGHPKVARGATRGRTVRMRGAVSVSKGAAGIGAGVGVGAGPGNEDEEPLGAKSPALAVPAPMGVVPGVGVATGAGLPPLPAYAGMGMAMGMAMPPMPPTMDPAQAQYHAQMQYYQVQAQAQAQAQANLQAQMSMQMQWVFLQQQALAYHAQYGASLAVPPRGRGGRKGVRGGVGGKKGQAGRGRRASAISTASDDSWTSATTGTGTGTLGTGTGGGSTLGRSGGGGSRIVEAVMGGGAKAKEGGKGVPGKGGNGGLDWSAMESVNSRPVEKRTWD